MLSFYGKNTFIFSKVWDSKKNVNFFLPFAMKEELRITQEKFFVKEDILWIGLQARLLGISGKCQYNLWKCEMYEIVGNNDNIEEGPDTGQGHKRR